MTRKTLTLDSRLHDYLLSVSLREPPVLRELREATDRLPERQMQIAPEQGQFMAMLLRLIGVNRAIEIGVFTGYSALVTALALPEDGRLVACDVNTEWTTLARKYWRRAGVEQKIDLRLAPALATLQALMQGGHGESFDFVFIDADKENYLAYYEASLPLLRRGGLICVDNTLWSGHVADPSVQDEDTQAIRAFNQMLLGDERVDISLIPLADGLTLIRKR
ncbi:MAG: class I SAM-dependent methyltransferase [Pseudomonadota bacterium]|nr:class I SAM-dependent methyltransferase [Pseudomonadota bacterium]